MQQRNKYATEAQPRHNLGICTMSLPVADNEVVWLLLREDVTQGHVLGTCDLIVDQRVSVAHAQHAHTHTHTHIHR